MVFTKPVPNRMVQTGVRSGFYRGMVGPLPDPCMFRITEEYAKFSIEDRPLVTTMNMGPDKPLVESAFGLLQEGSVLSYQQPALTSRSLALTMEMARRIEEATREQSSSSEWHLLRRPRVTASRF
ncbi:hypothetical protein SKAU_G00156390 [Synaphobranchus kaupii]|uniref:Uncharacterized protein n=1 Tax=Synaphobranchus kaupii TaxID=118154 RepID=A0A9Q1IX66_SYNKA|nr:hypothetical protein SKAU_G00156390 [Synaphobranchus kaupii]